MVTHALAPARLPEGRRVYAVGDVHGCADRLVRIHAAIAADLAARPAPETVLLHLGDYVDRGPDSAGVVALLARGPDVPVGRVVNLMGNHEQMMLAAVATADPDATALWLHNGGQDSLRSWGVPADAPPDSWAAGLPSEHLTWLRDLAVKHVEGPYLFVHAGIRPEVPLERQSRHDMLWIRDPFLTWDEPFGPPGQPVVVVHGHTPVPDPVVRPNRIGIDTGATYGGRLTCLVLEEDCLGFIFA
ncbi:MAG TPA: metallophosphoesterase family protein [Acetobacteraceae bacterium]|nr:metallophosphoesterase family protein [Acetobacteraceae bacterium]